MARYVQNVYFNCMERVQIHIILNDNAVLHTHTRARHTHSTAQRFYIPSYSGRILSASRPTAYTHTHANDDPNDETILLRIIACFLFGN